MPPGDWKLAILLLLVVGGLPQHGVADSPTWADERMHFQWPPVLAESPPIAGPQTDSSKASGAHFDDPRGTSATALWWEGSLSDGDLAETAPLVTPVSIIAAIPVHQPQPVCGRCEAWRILPAGILYNSYIAGEKEPRMAAALLSEKDRGSVFEATIGGRFGFLRYGTAGPINPQGFQWDLEGAAMLRQDPEEELDVEAVDFRVGSVLTWRRGPTATKFGYYHLSSHVGDEFLLRNPAFPRLNYVRDAILLGVRQRVWPDLTVYGEVAYSLKTDGGAEPWELQFGVEYTPLDLTDCTGAPFVAVNGHLREEFDFGGSVNVLAGWEWRGPDSGRRLRVGGQYYAGKEIQWSFFDESVTFTGIGIWYDF